MAGRTILFAAVACATLAAPSARGSAPVGQSGAAVVWEKLRKLQTTASVMHTTAHPDDEHGGLLTLLSRGQGARVSMLTLTRGESGDNAIGPELFDALGLIRTEELLLSDKYYGVDQQYFTSVVDYGFSKRLDEAIEKWGREHVLRDMVRIIRTERPWVVISRFQGNERDGHGNHQAAGLLTQEAFKAAADPSMFDGDPVWRRVRPWQPLKLYMGGVRANEDWTISVDTGTYDPVLGDTYQNIARLGLSFQRSQHGGRFMRQFGPSLSYYKLLASDVPPGGGRHTGGKEQSFFDGIDTSLGGVYRVLGAQASPRQQEWLTVVEREIETAIQSFSWTDPCAAAPALARALAALRKVVPSSRRDLHMGFEGDGGAGEVAFVLARKQKQIEDALTAALGIELSALAQPAGAAEPSGPFAAPADMGPVAPAQTFDIRMTFINRSRLVVNRAKVGLEGRGDWNLQADGKPVDAGPNQPIVTTLRVTVPEHARVTKPHFSRSSIQDARYTIAEAERIREQMFQPTPEPPLEAIGRYEFNGVSVMFRRRVTRLEANLPYGHDTRVVAIVPRIAVTVTPEHAIVPLKSASRMVTMKGEVLNNGDGKTAVRVEPELPASWVATPPTHTFEFSRAGERAQFSFRIDVPQLEDRDYKLSVVAYSGGKAYRTGYRTIRHRDLETRYLYRDATTTVRGVDVTIAPGLKVGYVMGIGDEVPAGLTQVGVDVQLLGAQDLATADLSRFHAIMTGTRAYAVREDLKTYNRRLLEYVRDGGNLIVLYNTQEFIPAEHAPYPAELPRNAEEVSEEDSPVEILAPLHQVFTTPNRITKADFDGWVEQRGSKFWTTWDSRYTPLIATWDRGQPPQKGGWLHARYGKGHYTYFAYAFHRQLPYGVPGAYRLLANLLSLNRF